MDMLGMLVLILLGILGVFALVSGTIFAAICQYSLWEDQAMAGVAAVLTFFFCASGIMLFISFSFHRINGRVVDDLESAKIASSKMLQRVIFIWGAYSSVNITQRAARRGLRDVTIRTWRGQKPAPINPISVNFEAKPLDQSETVFQDLREGVIGGGSERTDRTNGLPSRIIALIGGWAAVVAVGATLLFAIFGGFLLSKGKPIMFFQFVGVVVVIFFLRIIVSGGAQRTRWIVPGGLVCRSMLRRSGGSGLRLYARPDSILWVAQVTPRLWSVVVARGKQSERFRATRAEADMLLRAWLSPIDPPPLDRLKEFE